jgi:NAD(P)-dependent dehydrogenase (short-subunit alcohol dehydrogenase family)
MQQFEDQIAIVTGGASGIGRAAVDRLIAAGAKVASFDLVDFEKPGSHVFSQKVDVTDRDSVRQAVGRTIENWGRVNLLVNAAGIGAAGTILDNGDDEWTRVFDTNVMGTVRVSQEVIPHLLKQKASAIVNVASIVATTGFPNRALYSASKGALVSLTLAMAADYLDAGLRVNAVCPGTTETPWILRLLEQADNPEEERRKLVARQLHGRLVSAEEVAEAIAYLLSPLAGSTNGAVMPVDSGITALYAART